MARKVEKTIEEWASTLTPDQLKVARQKGTVRAFTGEYDGHKGDGVLASLHFKDREDTHRSEDKSA